MVHGSLFSGIGGFDLGFQRAGIETRWQVEIDPYCRRVLAKHFPGVRRYTDIRECGKHNLPSVDILSGGFPCQDISNAGKRAGIDGERSGLWSEYARIIRELRPRYVVVENVAALLGRGMERVLGDLAACGYDAEWQSIRASDVGAPHRRERIWIVAYSGRSERRPFTKRRHESDGNDAGREEATSRTTQCREDVSNAIGSADGRFHGRRNDEAAAIESAGSCEDVADADANGCSGILREAGRGKDEPKFGPNAVGPGPGPNVADAESLAERSRLCESGSGIQRRRRSGDSGCPGDVADTNSRGFRMQGESSRQNGFTSRDSETFPDASGSGLSITEQQTVFGARRGQEGRAIAECDWWATEPDVGRVAHGVPARVDRLKGLGNAIVPQIAEWIGRQIVEMESK